MSSDSPVIVNFTGFKPRLKRLRKRALLSYLTQPLDEMMAGQKTTRFSNSGIVISWVKALNELGYAVDVVNWDDTKFITTESYDLAVVHGGKNYKELSRNLSSGYKLIYFSTGTYWQFSNQQEDKRLKGFNKRHGINLPYDRFINESEEEVNKAADGIIGLGNNFTRQTYRKFKNVHIINSGNYPDDHFDKTTKYYAAAKNNWLFFAGGGNIHKGLDLVIDAFRDLPQELYVVTPLEKAFMKAYKNGVDLKNIYFIGETPMRTERFYEIADKCAFQIFPSCSEGQPGSVIEAMSLGIVPVISRESGIDIKSPGIILNDSTVNSIRESITKMCKLEPKNIQRSAYELHLQTINNHNPDKFVKDLKKAITAIIENT